jgi:hypothetical protein
LVVEGTSCSGGAGAIDVGKVPEEDAVADCVLVLEETGYSAVGDFDGCAFGVGD